jgi:hypothetical protein
VIGIVLEISLSQHKQIKITYLKNLKPKVMKLQSNNLLENLTTEKVKNLLTITPETIDHDFKKNKKRIFTAAEFLQIQKRKRIFSVRRFAVA